ncbi:hypothetical protein F5884DRAFT_15101 [Xylogone sp. PMI_703]|nr:hypothetical protein F5884DRAFT_15101 [Xylogone sp. PMI_703]
MRLAAGITAVEGRAERVSPLSSCWSAVCVDDGLVVEAFSGRWITLDIGCWMLGLPQKSPLGCVRLGWVGSGPCVTPSRAAESSHTDAFVCSTAQRQSHASGVKDCGRCIVAVLYCNCSCMMMRMVVVVVVKGKRGRASKQKSMINRYLLDLELSVAHMSCPVSSRRQPASALGLDHGRKEALSVPRSVQHSSLYSYPRSITRVGYSTAQ